MALSLMPEIGLPVQILPLNRYAKSGIYFLYLNDEVVYVGQAADMRKRIGSHLVEGIKNFDAISCIPCEKQDLSKAERYYIAKLVPKYNRCALSKDVRSLVDAGWIDAPAEMAIDKGQVLVGTARAAHFLGLTIDELKGLGPEGPKAVVRRQGKNRTRVSVYDMNTLHAYAQAQKAALPKMPRLTT